MKWLVMNDDGDILEFFSTPAEATDYLTRRIEQAGDEYDEGGYPSYINGISIWQQIAEVRQIPSEGGLAICPVKP